MPRPADKTPWFKGSTTPVRPGVYERKPNGASDRWSRWNGYWWCVSEPTPELAASRKSMSGFQNRPWRGLIKGSMPNA